MKAQEQWFEPGDKVMRVAYLEDIFPDKKSCGSHPQSGFGIVLCVASCWAGEDGWNRVLFIGIATHPGKRWLAACFRRVEEIQLCIRAAEALRVPDVKLSLLTTK